MWSKNVLRRICFVRVPSSAIPYSSFVDMSALKTSALL
nr:MAG TPA: hypothetical protein [Caudoviricetes sp.]